MFVWIFIIFAMAMGDDAWNETPAAQSTGVASVQFQAEPQTATGKFTTATEIKPILGATRSSWIAVREYNGQDLLYLTHLLSWRCGLLRIRYAVNDGALQDWPMPPCHQGTAAPNAITGEDGLPYANYELGSIRSVRIELLYDDLSEDSASFQRSEVLMP